MINRRALLSTTAMGLVQAHAAKVKAQSFFYNPAEFFRVPGTNLSGLVGYVPAGYNMLPTPGGTQNFQTDWTDFSNTRNWIVTGTEGRSTAAQLTLVTGLPGPDSSNHATRLVETTLNDNHSICSNYLDATGHVIFTWNALDAPVPIRTAAIIRAQERTRVVLGFLAGNSAAAYQVSIGYDLAGGNTGYDNLVGANMTLVGTHMTNLGNGWWLIYFDHYVSSGALTPITTSNNNYQPTIFLDNGSGTAARSISYAGDITKGLEVLWFNVLPVAMWAFTQKTFDEDFVDLSTIDLTNSKAPGFKWYINNRFPNCDTHWTGFWNVAGTNIPSNPLNFSIVSPSVLQLWNDGTHGISTSPGFSNQFWSVVTNTNTPGTIPGYIGETFHAPILMEMSAAFDLSAADSNPNWASPSPAFWGVTTPTLTGVGWAADGGFHFLEWDVIEGSIGVDQAAGGTLHDWYNSGGNNTQFPSGGFNFVNGSADWPPALFSNGFRKITGLWVNAAYNNYTWGFFMAFQDGQWTHGPGTSPAVYSPAGNVGNGQAVGSYSLSDGHPFTVFFDCAESSNASFPVGFKSQIDWIRVWQPAVIPTVYAFWNAYDMGTLGGAGLTPTLSQNGYQVTKPGADASFRSARAHLYVGYNKVGGGVSAGKWYWEYTLTGGSMGNTSDFMLGIGNTAALVSTNPGGSAKGAGLQYNTAANTNVNGVTGLTASTVTWVSGDVIGFAFDADAGHVYIHKNGTYINGNPGSGNGVWTVTSDTWWPMAAMKTAGSTNAVSANFGQKAFAFSVPSGYNAGVF